ncbi:Uncharacterized protein BM_BM18197 [Brugia malayi]|uniref:Uncharacterized protein n=1 Tax=Brugia malayi TaxID=6279 RepID=A0A4E9F508_BRUMA|nr:Uncharacterized protein BM_BM18197 [Brugia malayi]
MQIKLIQREIPLLLHIYL